MNSHPPRNVLLALLAAALVAFVIPTSANHLQRDSGKAIAFDHKTGNAYWVEVVVTGADASRVSKVEAQTGQPGGVPWTTLEKKSWGAYGASFPLGSDTLVRFRATFTDGMQAVSCWFDHPEGTEQCSYNQPLGTWRSSVIGDVGNAFEGGESVLVDIDNDGVDELLVASDAGLFRFDRTATGWTKQLVVPPPAPGYGFDQVVVGSTDGDSVVEVYTAGHVFDGQTGSDRLMWHHFTGTQWFSQEVWRFNDVHDMAVGDIDDDGVDDLYVVTTIGPDQAVYGIRRDAFAESGFRFNQLHLEHDDNLGLIAVGDADRDGDDEAYVLYGFDDGTHQLAILRIDVSGTGVPSSTRFNRGSWGIEVRGLVVGDGDGNGNDEVYVLVTTTGSATLQRFAIREGTFAMTGMVLGEGPHQDLVLGDGDNDGKVELYSGTLEGHLVKMHFADGVWDFVAVHQLGSGERMADLVLGDGENDGKNELYALSADSNARSCCPPTHVQRIAIAGGGTTTTTSTTTTSGGTFDATFTGVRGNEWWVQANVGTSGATLASVDVRLNGGAWLPLAKQSWGGWATSTRIPDGTTVQLRATGTTGATDLSDCYRWIPARNTDAAKVSCGATSTSSTTTTSAALDATFSGVKGNDWWVQASVSGSQPIQNVDARVNCSEEWRSLTKQSYGWAASFHVPSGSKVDFRAISTSGNMDFSGGYIWPSATPTSRC